MKEYRKVVFWCIDILIFTGVILVEYLKRGIFKNLSTALAIIQLGLLIVAVFLIQAWNALKPKGLFVRNSLKARYHKLGKPEKYREFCVGWILGGIAIIVFGFVMVLLHSI